eukprot:4310215-Pyramimonas_sp.AAC.1
MTEALRRGPGLLRSVCCPPSRPAAAPRASGPAPPTLPRSSLPSSVSLSKDRPSRHSYSPTTN